MNYSYEIERFSATQNFMRVRYDSDGLPSIMRAFNPGTSVESELVALIESAAPGVIAEWTRIQALPSEVTEANLSVTSGSVIYTPPPAFTATEPPAYDEFTHRLESGVDGTNTQTWTVVALTAQEQADYLTQWRATTQVSMRQARLALLQQGLLANVDAAIAGMTEPDRTSISIEWEYAAVVDRSSPWMAGMAVALGLSETDMDNLFRLAQTL